MAAQVQVVQPQPPLAGPNGAGNTGQFQSTSLYVGDLEVNVTDSQLYDMFSQLGAVVSVRVCRDLSTRRSLGYGYVNYSNTQDAARALDVLNFNPLNGKPIRIMYSHRDPSIRRSGTANIFIKNLDKAIDNKALHETFSAFGNILYCKIAVDGSAQSKGYGFVQYDTEEAAQKAIDKFNGMLLNDKPLFVGPFLRKQERDMSSDKVKFNNVFVKNLSESTTDDELKKVFVKYGNITSAVVMRDADGKSKCFGFVNFENTEDAGVAVEALNGKKIEDKEWFVRKAHKKIERGKELNEKFNTMKETVDKFQGVNLYVKNLDDSVDDDKLRELFVEFGTITSCKVMRDPNGISKGSGFVAFPTPEESSRALAEMNGKMIASKPLYVALAQPKEYRRARLQDFFDRDVEEGTLLLASYEKEDADGVCMSYESRGSYFDATAEDYVVCTKPIVGGKPLFSGVWHEEEDFVKSFVYADYVALFAGPIDSAREILIEVEKLVQQRRRAGDKVYFDLLEPILLQTYAHKLKEETKKGQLAADRMKTMQLIITALKTDTKLLIRTYGFSPGKGFVGCDVRDFVCAGSGRDKAEPMVEKYWCDDMKPNSHLRCLLHEVMHAVSRDLDVVGVGGLHRSVTIKLEAGGNLSISQSVATKIDILYKILKFEDPVDGEDGEVDVWMLPIEDAIIKALTAKGILKLFPIQRFLMVVVKSGSDILCRARTGMGKTLGYGIQLMDSMLKEKSQNGQRDPKKPMALIVALNEQLAQEIEKEFLETAPGLNTRRVNVDLFRQSALEGVDVVVGTPGSIYCHLNRLKLSAIKFSVLVDADAMLAKNSKELDAIIQYLPAKRQSIMFSSGTMSPGIRKLSKKYLKHPVNLDLVDSALRLSAKIKLYKVNLGTNASASVLHNLITGYAKGGRTLVFTNSQRDAIQLEESISNEQKFKCGLLLEQGDRKKTLSQFQKGDFNVLVSTDVAAHGIDVPTVKLVIHNGNPVSTEIFLLRTRRARPEGTSILIYSGDEITQVERDICGFTKLSIAGLDDNLARSKRPREEHRGTDSTSIFAGDVEGGSALALRASRKEAAARAIEEKGGGQATSSHDTRRTENTGIVSDGANTGHLMDDDTALLESLKDHLSSLSGGISLEDADMSEATKEDQELALGNLH